MNTRPIKTFFLLLAVVLTSCSKRPNQQTLEKPAQEISKLVIKSKLAELALKNSEHRCFRYAEDAILIFSRGVNKAISSNESGNITEDLSAWAGHKTIALAQFYDATLCRYTLDKVSFGEITAGQKGRYLCSVNITFRQSEMIVKNQPGFPIYAMTDFNWSKRESSENFHLLQNWFTLLPSQNYNYNYLMRFCKQSALADYNILHPLAAPIWEAEESIVSVAVTIQWDIKVRKWIIDEQKISCIYRLETLPSWPPSDIDNEELSRHKENQKLIHRQSRYWLPEAYDIYQKLAERQAYISGTWLTHEANEARLKINALIQQIEMLPSSITRPTDLIQQFNLLLLHLATIKEPNIKPFFLEAQLKCRLKMPTIIEFLISSSNFMDSSDWLRELEENIRTQAHWDVLNNADIQLLICNGKRQLLEKEWKLREKRLQDMPLSESSLEQMLNEVPALAQMAEQCDDKRKRQFFQEVIRDYILQYSLSLVKNQEVAALQSLAKQCGVPEIQALLPDDFQTYFREQQEIIRTSMALNDNEFLNHLKQSRKYDSDWPLEAFQLIVRRVQSQALNGLIDNNSVEEKIQQMTEYFWPWHASSQPILITEEELSEKVESIYAGIYAGIIKRKREAFLEEAENNFPLLTKKPLKVFLNNRVISTQAINYDETGITYRFNSLIRKTNYENLLKKTHSGFISGNYSIANFDHSKNNQAKESFVVDKLRLLTLTEDGGKMKLKIRQVEIDKIHIENTRRGYLFYTGQWLSVSQLFSLLCDKKND